MKLSNMRQLAAVFENGGRRMTRIILFLLRMKLGIKKNERFQFDNQKNKTDYYYVSDSRLHKIMYRKGTSSERRANVSLNWLLDSECKIVRIGGN